MDKACKDCIHFIGAGDWDLCCTEHHDGYPFGFLCYEDTLACEKFEKKDDVEKRNLYFQRSNGEHRLLATDVTEDEAHREMQKFMDAHKFKSYYTSSCEIDGVKIYDVGSWTEFFKWTNKELK